MSHNSIPPPAFHVMAKPAGAACNLNCSYCFYLKKQSLYPDSSFRMSDAVMESYLRQTIEAHRVPEITIAWQGGEPTLMGLEFFRRVVKTEKMFQKEGTGIRNTLQTNGTLLTDEWCAFFKEHKFLVGLSLDGPEPQHNAYRKDRTGNPTFDSVMRGLRLLQKHNVEYNILCTVNAANSAHPLTVYRFFRDEAGARYLQFIPIVERDTAPGSRERGRVTARSVQAKQWGVFLNTVFDEWISRDVGTVFVQLFDGVLAAWLRGESSLCIFRRTCSDGVALEHNGDLYSCDHFVDPDHLLGNITGQPLAALLMSERQQRFGRSKQLALPRCCRDCGYLFACNGECPKNRILPAADGGPQENYLCQGLRSFFSHTERPMKIMAALLKRGCPASEIMTLLACERNNAERSRRDVGRNDPCPCGSGLKYKKCHGVS